MSKALEPFKSKEAVDLINRYFSQIKPTTLKKYAEDEWFITSDLQEIKKLFPAIPVQPTKDDVYAVFTKAGFTKFKRSFLKWRTNQTQKKIFVSNNIHSRLKRIKEEKEFDDFDQVLEYALDGDLPSSSVLENAGGDVFNVPMTDEKRLKVFVKKLDYTTQQFLLKTMLQIAKASHESGFKLRKFNDQRFVSAMENIPQLQAFDEDIDLKFHYENLLKNN